MDPQTSFAPSYRHVAWCYDALASAYSLGAIDRAKRVHHDLIEAGDHVLYAGAGRGAEIVQACDRGAEVTCVEPCAAMALRGVFARPKAAVQNRSSFMQAGVRIACDS